MFRLRECKALKISVIKYNIENCTENAIRFTAVSRIKQLDFGEQKWPTIEINSNLAARALKIKKIT